MAQQQVNISNEQIARAAQSTSKLLTDDERVNVPPSLALSGDLTVIMGVLGGLASGALIVGNSPEGQEVVPANQEEGAPALLANEDGGAVVASTD
tara:strand:- start:472 stop:756 length:285 start_codon:yes stop_codon:yes gene_type:complete